MMVSFSIGVFYINCVPSPLPYRKEGTGRNKKEARGRNKKEVYHTYSSP
jgi:hypothetical protein|tara:strand:- start:616 stop:762 length:147 start_codon:yes stop_codon:yes gene_type:complete